MGESGEDRQGIEAGRLGDRKGIPHHVMDLTNFKVTIRAPPGHSSNQLPKLIEPLPVLRYEISLTVVERQEGLPPTCSRVQLVLWRVK